MPRYRFTVIMTEEDEMLVDGTEMESWDVYCVDREHAMNVYRDVQEDD